MKKISILLCILIATVMVLSLAACGESQSASHDGTYVLSKYYEGSTDKTASFTAGHELSDYKIAVSGTRFEIEFKNNKTVGIADYSKGTLSPENPSDGDPLELSFEGNTMTIGNDSFHYVLEKQ